MSLYTDISALLGVYAPLLSVYTVVYTMKNTYDCSELFQCGRMGTSLYSDPLIGYTAYLCARERNMRIKELNRALYVSFGVICDILGENKAIIYKYTKCLDVKDEKAFEQYKKGWLSGRDAQRKTK